MYAVEAVIAEYAEKAVAVCCLMGHGLGPWRCLGGVEADGLSIARVYERSCGLRGVEGVKAGRRLYVQDRCGDVHVGLVAEAVTVNEDSKCILRCVWLRSQDLEDPVMALDVAANWMQSRRRIDQARRCGRRPAPSKCVGVQSSCCSRYRTYRCVYVSSVRGRVGEKMALNMDASSAYWSVGCYMYRYHESPGGMVLELVEGIVSDVMCKYHESPGNKLLRLVGSVISCVCSRPIKGACNDASKHVKNEAVYALMYDYFILNKPLLLDSSLITRSIVSINLGLTITSYRSFV